MKRVLCAAWRNGLGKSRRIEGTHTEPHIGLLREVAVPEMHAAAPAFGLVGLERG